MRNCPLEPDVAELNPVSQAQVPHICLLTEMFYPVVGGGETHARLLAQSLNDLGMRTFVLTRRSDKSFPRSETISGTPTHRVSPAGPNRFGKYAMVPFALVELFRRRHEYDIIFVCGFRVLGLSAVLMSRLFHKACVLRAESQGEMSGGYASAFRKLPTPVAVVFRSWIGFRNWVLKQANGYVGISKPIAEEFVECGMDTRRIFKFPNGIESKAFTPVDADGRRSLREKLGLPVDRMIASYSGKLNQGKGLEHLLRAWVDVSEAREDAHLVLIGSGGGQSLSREDELRAYVRDNALESSVTFTGYVENVNEYLQASDMFILPTENEAFPLSLLEAMSCRLPVIASRVGGIPEIVSHLDNGILVNPADPDALSSEIVRLMGEPSLAGSLAANARQTACDRYSIESVAARYYELFSSMRTRGGRVENRNWRRNDAGETRQELS